MNNDDLQRQIERYCVVLGEQFDSVRILATITSPDGGTVSFTHGSGNIMAQMGHAEEWLRLRKVRSNEHTKMQVRAEMGADLEDSDVDGEV